MYSCQNSLSTRLSDHSSLLTFILKVPLFFVCLQTYLCSEQMFISFGGKFFVQYVVIYRTYSYSSFILDTDSYIHVLAHFFLKAFLGKNMFIHVAVFCHNTSLLFHLVSADQGRNRSCVSSGGGASTLLAHQCSLCEKFCTHMKCAAKQWNRPFMV